MAKKPHNGPSMTPEEGLEHFKQLGPGRTLPRLEKALAENPAITKAPGLDCLKRWSQKHGWTAEAKAYDAGVISRAAERQLEDQIKERFEFTAAFTKTGAQILERVRSEVSKLDVKTVDDLAKLAQIGVVCAREADACLGQKPLEAPEPKETPKADNVTEGAFPALPAPKSENENALQALEAMTGGGPPN